ncbi:hypothetical protein [Peribacillus frigoritolerans]|uniref:hypothetical protein n=1 Tax=Peribacillus frigoritolerans TaxID=450367 RepID=UPI003B8D1AA7
MSRDNEKSDKETELEIQQITGGIYFIREIKAVMLIGNVFHKQYHWVQSEAHLLRVQNLTEHLVIVHNRRCQLELSKSYMNHISHSNVVHDIGKARFLRGFYKNLAR